MTIFNVYYCCLLLVGLVRQAVPNTTVKTTTVETKTIPTQDPDVKDCDASPCLNGGTCLNLNGSYQCSCPLGWQGDNCETDVNECFNNPCKNGANCINMEGNFRCLCLPQWTGKLCDTDPRCTPSTVTVTISDDEEPGCDNVYPLNITCSNWGENVAMRFDIGSWKYVNTIRLQYSYTRYPAVCVYGQSGQLKDQFGHYETILNVTTGQGAFANKIPLIFNITEMSDPPRIRGPADIYVKERDTQPLVWNITYFDPDDDYNSTSKHNITSSDIPEQLIIRTTTVGETQYFDLVRVKAFDADSYENRGMEPRGEYRFKRSINSKSRYKGSSKSAYTYAKQLFMRYPRKRRNTRKERSARFPRQFEGDAGHPGPVVNFTLEISDETGLSTSYVVSVNINDLNDNEPICESPGTVAIARHADQLESVFEMRRICIDQDYNFRNQISDYRFSNMQQDCMGVFGIYSYGTLYLKDSVPENMSTCEFDVVAMDPTYATTVHLILAYGECAASVDARGVLWNASQPGRIEHMSCPDGYTGTVSRFCNNFAKYEPAVYQCTSQTISDINDKMDDIYYNSKSTNLSIVTTLNELKNATEGILLNGDMDEVFNTLNRATAIVKYRRIEEASKPEAFLGVASNLLKVNNTRTWESIMYKEGKGAEMVIETIDNYIGAVANEDHDSFTEQKDFVTENLVLSVGAVSGCNKDMDFPNKSATSVPDWLINSDNKVHLQCSSAGQNKYFSSTFYKNVTKLIPFRTFEKALKNKTVNSAIASFSLFPDEKTKLDPPIEVTFDVLNTSMKDPKCSYWKPDPNPYRGLGSWATDGCKLKSYKNGIVVCLCDHLTNFAILMSPVDPEEIPEAHTAALSIISLVGCIISMVCLLITVVVYIIYWKKIKSERSMILLNLCITLFIAYLVFLIGVNETENKAGCTAVAIILHFVYLVVFLLMFVQGMNLAITVIKPLRKQRFGWQMVVAAYGTSILIVAISMGATQLDGYGSDRFCWLSVDSGLLWAFLVPVLFVIVANSIIVVIVLKGMFGTAAVKKKTEKEKLKTGIRSICILMPVMGITWIFGVFSVNAETVIFQYLFAIFNSIQGILIFVFHCVLNQKIQEAFKKSKAAQLFTSETATSDTERSPMKSAETADTTVKSYVV